MVGGRGPSVLGVGLRRGEVLGLRWDDVDLDRREPTVAFQLQRVRRQLLHRETKTESSEATLPLPELCVGGLRAHRVEQDARRSIAGNDWHRSGLVFTTRHGTPVEPSFHRDFKGRCRKAGVRGISVHTARRTCASLLVALDVHPRVAMQIPRHSQIAITMNVYNEAPSKATRTALKRLAKQLHS
ncbi:MAG TPA: site-specific integrase [Asanoa sp.]